jgi:serine/threonine protein kinase
MGHALEFFGLGLPGRPDAALLPSWQAYAPETLPPGYELGDRFEIAELLGTRVHTQIYRGKDRRTGTPVKIRRHDDAEADDAAWREHELLGRLRHPAVPRAIAALQDGGRACFVQTYLEGPTLREAFKRKRVFGEARATRILASALETLAYLHARRPPVLHRDLKPANMVLGRTTPSG